MSTDDRPLKDKTDAEIDTIIAKRIPGDALRKQAAEERQTRRAEHDATIQGTQEKILSKTNIILWLTVIAILVGLAGVIATLVK